MNIKTERHAPDSWTAIDESTYDGPCSAMGYGRTEQEAIDDLREEIAERAANPRPCACYTRCS